MYLDEQINEEMFRCVIAGINVDEIPRYHDYFERRKEMIKPAEMPADQIDDMIQAVEAMKRDEGETEEIGQRTAR